MIKHILALNTNWGVCDTMHDDELLKCIKKNPFPSQGAAVAGIDITRMMICRDDRRASEIRSKLINNILNNYKAKNITMNILNLIKEDNTTIQKKKLDQSEEWINSGIKLAKNNEFEKAEKAFYKAIQIKPKNNLAWYYLVILRMDYNSVERLQKLCREKLILNPKSESAWITLGNLMKYEDYYEDFDSFFKTYMNIEQDNPKMWKNIGDLYYGLGGGW